MRKILVNDGIETSGKVLLEAAGFHLDMNKIPQEELISKLNNYDVICVRSATKVRQAEIDAAPNLKIIARGGVGLDNIDVDYAQQKGIKVINTPAASSRSVAELAFAHIFSLARFLNHSNKIMHSKGGEMFNELKKAYAKGIELEGKTIGIVGLGRIGQEAAKIAIGLGMNVLGYDPYVKSIAVNIGSKQYHTLATVEGTSMEYLLKNSDIITIHVPGLDKPVLSEAEFAKMKKGTMVINIARGGIIEENALLKALSDGTVSAAGLDVFVGEPTPRQEILSHPNISLTPHIGASTNEAQEKIGEELARQIIDFFA